MKLPLKEAIVRNLKKAFAEKKKVLAAYIFGSRSGGFSSSKSDLDLAIVVSDRNKVSERELIKFISEKEDKIPYSLARNTYRQYLKKSILFANRPINNLWQSLRKDFCLFLGFAYF